MKQAFLEEEIRIEKNRSGEVAIWDAWGPFVSERSWGTVREDYSESGDAWNYLSHDAARSTAYRWGEDGIAGLCDRYQVCSLSLALWNHKDDILKERLFGLTADQGNHGEDVKELYYYLENCPSHAFMRYLYKYPQEAFPYEKLVLENQKRTNKDPEYELYDTGVFGQNRYFDVVIEYVKLEPDEIGMRIEITNQSDAEAILDVIPQLTFRNTWSWQGKDPKQKIEKGDETDQFSSVVFDDHEAEAFPMLDVKYNLGKRYLYGSPGAKLLFTNNDTNLEKFQKGKNRTPYVKDAFHRAIIDKEDCLNPDETGTKVGFHYKDMKFSPKETKVVRMRLSKVRVDQPLGVIDAFCKKKEGELHEFYKKVLNSGLSPEEHEIQKKALYGHLWNRQLYLFIQNYWLKGDSEHSPISEREKIRNMGWKHLVSKHVIQMPDKWEYPWFAAWDLAFHSITTALYDIELAKDQLWLLMTEMFQHPNGQIPAYEWEFSDLNPPNQALAALKIYEMERNKKGKGDVHFLKRCFQKLVTNFVWWVNQKDQAGKNIFEGGFLGLDNITVIDRSRPLPDGEFLEQSDATGWMGLFCLNMMRIAMIIAENDSDYEVMITKFFRHYIYIAMALKRQNWSDTDNFFYDVICYPDGKKEQIPVRSLVGIIPLFAIECISEEKLRQYKNFYPQFEWFLLNRPDLVEHCFTPIEKEGKLHYFFSLLSPKSICQALERTWDEEEFKSEFGLRSLSKVHEKNPVTFQNHEIHYAPRESDADLYGGNSNWRGPIWMPISYLFLDLLKRLDTHFGDAYKVRDKADGTVTFKEMSKYYSNALTKLFIKDDKGEVPSQIKSLPWNNQILFYEYFHGDTGEGLGASHQTGWTSLIANILEGKQ